MSLGKFKIAVIRGGAPEVSTLESGKELIYSLVKNNHSIKDVIVDKNGVWFESGKETDAHLIFTVCDYYIDLVDRKKAGNHHALARSMGVKELLSSGDMPGLGRDDVFRILRQHNILVPDTDVIRHFEDLNYELLHKIWNTYHTPILVRPAHFTKSIESKLIRNFNHLGEFIKSVFDGYNDAMIVTYKESDHFHVATVKNLRGEEVYTSLPIKSTPKKHSKPDKNTTLDFPRLTEEDKMQLEKKSKEIMSVLPFETFAGLDFIKTKNGFMLVDVNPHPNIASGSRFMRSLETTGVTPAEIVMSHLDRQAV